MAQNKSVGGWSRLASVILEVDTKISTIWMASIILLAFNLLRMFSGDCSQYRCSLPAGKRFPCLENLVG